MQRTPLNATHRNAGAKLVDFAGWEMPLHYGSQIEEHHAVRRDAGMFDTSHMLAIDVAGAAATALLRYALANDVDKLREPGRALYTCMLREDGGILDDLIVYFRAGDRLRIVANAATAAKDHAWLDSIRAKRAPGVELESRRDLAMIAVQGPNSRAKVWAALPGTRAASESLEPFSAVDAGDIFVARTGYTGEDGFELLMPAEQAASTWQALAAQEVQPCGLAARDTLRLEAGMNLYGQDMDETVTPLESGLGWTVDLKHARDFVGKAALAGRAPQRRLVGLVLVDRGGVLRAHQGVRTSHGDGEITSGTFAPTMRQSIALARVPDEVAPGDMVEVAVREKYLRARVVKPPFVRNGKVLVGADA